MGMIMNIVGLENRRIFLQVSNISYIILHKRYNGTGKSFFSLLTLECYEGHSQI